MVQFAFELDVADTYTYGDEDAGWYIDNVQIKTGALVFNNPETWENGIGDWYVTNGTWEVGTPTSGPNSGYLSSNCAATRLSGSYYSNSESRLVSPPFQVSPTATNLVLRFRQWYNTGGGDYLYVQIKPAGSTTWETHGSGTYSGTSGGVWSYAFLPLTTYIGQTVNVCFFLDSNGGSNSGWYIDEVSINSAPYVVSPLTQLEMWEDTVDNSINLHDVFYDDDAQYGQVITYSCTGNTNIDVVINQSTGIVTISPHLNWYGSQLLTFKCTDQVGASVNSYLTVNVLPVNDPPQITLPDYVQFDQNGSLQLDFSAFVSDPDNDVLILSCSGNTNVLVSIIGLQVSFSATYDWTGMETVTFEVFDGSVYSSASLQVWVGILYIPAPVVQISLSGTNYLLTWSPVAQANSYKILAASYPDGPYDLISITVNNSYNASTISDHDARFFKVIASDQYPPGK